MEVIVIAKDASSLEHIQRLLSANFAAKVIAVAPSIVLPKNMAQAITFAEQFKPIVMAAKMNPGSNFCARTFEIEFEKSPTT